jgi:hypothetical protein
MKATPLGSNSTALWGCTRWCQSGAALMVFPHLTETIVKPDVRKVNTNINIINFMITILSFRSNSRFGG